jgi:hypothetical protein
VQEAQGLQRLDGVEPAGRRRPPRHRRRRHRRRLHELAVGAGRGGLAEHDEEVAVGARHGHHVAAGGDAAVARAPGVVRSGDAARLAVEGGRGRGDVELQVQGALLLLGGPRPHPALFHGLPVQVVHPPGLPQARTNNC